MSIVYKSTALHYITLNCTVKIKSNKLTGYSHGGKYIMPLAETPICQWVYQVNCWNLTVQLVLWWRVGLNWV